MFDFRGELERLCFGVPGTMAATVMGVDGLPIDYVEANASKGTDASALLIEYGGLLEQIRGAAQMLAAGALEEVLVRSEGLVCVMRVLGPEYFVALILSPEASTGQARFALRVRGPRIAEALR